MDCSLPGSSIHGLLQARILEWVAVPPSRGSSQCRDWTHISYVYLPWQAVSLPLALPGLVVKWKWKSLSCVRLFATPWTIQSMKFSRSEYWSGYFFPFPSPGDPQPRVWTQVSRIASWFFTSWATLINYVPILQASLPLCFRAFAFALSSAWNIFPPNICMCLFSPFIMAFASPMLGFPSFPHLKEYIFLSLAH